MLKRGLLKVTDLSIITCRIYLPTFWFKGKCPCQEAKERFSINSSTNLNTTPEVHSRSGI
jgi:hypothetical protein